eukprot:358487-Chlamydomonas_euryale.AAC.6
MYLWPVHAARSAAPSPQSACAACDGAFRSISTMAVWPAVAALSSASLSLLLARAALGPGALRSTWTTSACPYVAATISALLSMASARADGRPGGPCSMARTQATWPPAHAATSASSKSFWSAAAALHIRHCGVGAGGGRGLRRLQQAQHRRKHLIATGSRGAHPARHRGSSTAAALLLMATSGLLRWPLRVKQQLGHAGRALQHIAPCTAHAQRRHADDAAAAASATRFAAAVAAVQALHSRLDSRLHELLHALLLARGRPTPTARRSLPLPLLLLPLTLLPLATALQALHHGGAARASRPTLAARCAAPSPACASCACHSWAAQPTVERAVERPMHSPPQPKLRIGIKAPTCGRDGSSA